MHYTEYNQVCSKCDRPIEYKELGRSILITPCPCQTTELVKACQQIENELICLRMELADPQAGEVADMANVLTQTLANVTK